MELNEKRTDVEKLDFILDELHKANMYLDGKVKLAEEYFEELKTKWKKLR